MADFTIGSDSSNQPFHAKRVSSLILNGETLWTRLALQDIEAGATVLILTDDDEILERIPKKHHARTIYINPAETPFPLNVVANIKQELHATYAGILTQALIAQSNFQIDPVVLRKYLRRCFQTLLGVADTSLLSVYYLLTNPKYRSHVLKHVRDIVLKDIWDKFEAMDARLRENEIQSTVTRAEGIVLDPTLRASLDQKKNKLSVKDKVVVVNVSGLGEDNATLIGLLVLANVAIQDGNPTVYIKDISRYAYAETLKKQLTVIGLSDSLVGEWRQIFAYQTTFEDSERLSPKFRIADGETQLHGLWPDRLYALVDGTATELTEYPLDFPVIGGQKIKDRCANYAQPFFEVEERLGRFF